MNRNVSGFYHDPPMFLSETPVDHTSATVFFDRFDNEVLRTALAGGIQMRANVEGLFAFDFSAVADCAQPDTDDSRPDLAFDIRAEKVIRRTRIMNAYLAFFYTQEYLLSNFSRERMVVTPELTISMTGIDGNPGQSFGNQRVSHLATSRFNLTYASAIPPIMDTRITFRGIAVSADVVHAAASDLSLLIGNHGDDGVLLVDLYLRASKAYQDHNYSLSLTTNWTIIERILDDLWTKMQADNEYRQNERFIDRARRDRLGDTRSYTAAVRSEMLSFLGYLSKEIYEDLSAARRLRNEWMHRLKQIDRDGARRASTVCEHLLKQEKALTLIGATGLRIP